MPEDLVSANVNNYLKSLIPDRPEEVRAMESFAKENRFPIIGPVAGYMCYMIAKMINAKSVFELGSGYGYSTYWFARAVYENGGGTVHHVVWHEDLSKMARKHLNELGFGEIVKYQVSEAVKALSEAEGPFDLIFNDIDKEGYPDSLPIIKEKLKSGGALIIDNILWHGRIFDEDDQSPSTTAIRDFTNQITTDPDWVVSVIPIRDGLIVAYKK